MFQRDIAEFFREKHAAIPLSHLDICPNYSFSYGHREKSVKEEKDSLATSARPTSTKGSTVRVQKVELLAMNGGTQSLCLYLYNRDSAYITRPVPPELMVRNGGSFTPSNNHKKEQNSSY
jgi:hypothetical protein